MNTKLGTIVVLIEAGEIHIIVLFTSIIMYSIFRTIHYHMLSLNENTP